MLQDQLQSELNETLKSGDKVKRLVLSTLMAAIKNRQLTKRSQLSKTLADAGQLEDQSKLTDEEIIEVIASEAKKHRESIEQFSAGGRQELAGKEQAELEVLAAYLPEQLGEDQIRAEVEAAIKQVAAELGHQPTGPEVGKVMGPIMAKLKGRADGSIVSKIAKELLAG